MRLLNLFLNWRLGEESQLVLWLAVGKSDSPSPTKAMPKVSVNTQAGRDPWEEGLSDTTGRWHQHCGFELGFAWEENPMWDSGQAEPDLAPGQASSEGPGRGQGHSEAGSTVGGAPSQL